MKISKPAIILSAAGLGLTLVYSQQSTPETPTKAQQILRQKLAELKAGESLPGKGELLADVERLHKEGKISDEHLMCLAWPMRVGKRQRTGAVQKLALSPRAQCSAKRLGSAVNAGAVCV